jgi:hypothetical protein
VADHHLLDLIRETSLSAAPGSDSKPEVAAVAAAGSSEAQKFVAPLASEISAASLPLHPASELLGDQDDYLWGV